MLSKRRQIRVYVEWFNLFEVQEQTKLTYGDRGQNSSYFGGLLMGGDMKEPCDVLEIFY